MVVEQATFARQEMLIVGTTGDEQGGYKRN
jgi:hypothetical protein